MEAMRAAGRVAAIAPQDTRIDTAVGWAWPGPARSPGRCWPITRPARRSSA